MVLAKQITNFAFCGTQAPSRQLSLAAGSVLECKICNLFYENVIYK